MFFKLAFHILRILLHFSSLLHFNVAIQAAEAQEALEDESLTKVEVEVRQELAQSLEGEAVSFIL